MSSDSIIQERRGSVAIITLDRPEKLNALSSETIAALGDAFKNCENDAELRAVILTVQATAHSLPAPI